MRIFEAFILEGEQSLLRLLFKMLDLKGKKLCELFEMDLNMYLKSDMMNECI